MSLGKLSAVGVVAIYALLIAFNSAGFSPFDDFLFLQSFESGHWRGIQGGEFETGRMNFLHGLDLFILQCFGATGSRIYYTWNAIVFLLSFVFISKIYEKNGGKYSFLHVSLFAILLYSITFTSYYFRLLYPEKNIILFVAMLIYMSMDNIVLNGKKKWLYLIFINVAIHLKEPMIPTSIAIGTMYLFRYRWQSGEFHQDQLKGRFWLFSGLAAIIMYLIFVFPRASSSYGDKSTIFLLNLVKSQAEWCIGDPLLMFIFLPLLIITTIQTLRSKKITTDFIFATGGFAYMLTFWLKGIAYSSHYFAPVYVLAFLLFISNIPSKLYIKTYYSLIIIIQCLNIPLGIQDIRFQKLNNLYFNETLEKTANIIQNHTDSSKKLRFFVLGGQDIGNHFTYSFVYFLQKKVDLNNVDFATYEKAPTLPYPNALEKNAIYSFQNVALQQKPEAGDYIIFTPYTTENEENIKNSTLLFKREEKINFPVFNIKDIIRSIISNNEQFSGLVREKHSYRKANYAIYKHN